MVREGLIENKDSKVVSQLAMSLSGGKCPLGRGNSPCEGPKTRRACVLEEHQGREADAGRVTNEVREAVRNAHPPPPCLQAALTLQMMGPEPR